MSTVAETRVDPFGRNTRISYKFVELQGAFDMNVGAHQHKLLKRSYGFVERAFRSLILDGWDVNIKVAAPLRMWFPARRGTKATYAIEVKIDPLHELFCSQPELVLLAWVEVIDAVPDSQLPRGDGSFMPEPPEVHSSAALTESSRKQLGSKFAAASKCKSLMDPNEKGEDGNVTFEFIWKDLEPQLSKGAKQLMFCIREKCPPACRLRSPLQMHVLYKPPLIQFKRTEQFPAAAQDLAWRIPNTVVFQRAELDEKVTLTAKLNLKVDDAQDVEPDDWLDIMDADQAEDHVQHNDGRRARSQQIDQPHMRRLTAGHQGGTHVGATTVAHKGTPAAFHTSAHVQGTGEHYYMQQPPYQHPSLNNRLAAHPWDTGGDAHTLQRSSPQGCMSRGPENIPGGDTHGSAGRGASAHGHIGMTRGGRQTGVQAAYDGMTAGDPHLQQRFQHECKVGYGGAGSQGGYQDSCTASAYGQGTIEHHEYSRTQPHRCGHPTLKSSPAVDPRVLGGHTHTMEDLGDQEYVPRGPAIPGEGEHGSHGMGASSHSHFGMMRGWRRPDGQAARGRGEPAPFPPVPRHFSEVHNPGDGHDEHIDVSMLHGQVPIPSGHRGPCTEWSQSRGRGRTKTTGRGRGRAAQDPHGGGASSSPEDHSGIGERPHQMQADPLQALSDSAEIEPGRSHSRKDFRRATGSLVTGQQRSRGHAVGGSTASTVSSHATSRGQSVTTRTSSTPSLVSQGQAAWKPHEGGRQ